MFPARLILTLALPFSAALGSTTWYVDDDNCPHAGTGTAADPFCSIQEAIVAASDGDVVLVLPGLYLERIDFLGKSLQVVGRDGPAVTVIDGMKGAPVVTMDLPTGVSGELAGFTVTNGNTGASGRVAGIDATGSARIRQNVVVDNHSPLPGGIGGISALGEVLIEDNVVDRNSGDYSCGGIAYTGSGIIQRNRITNNGSAWGVGGLSAGGPCQVIENDVISNGSGYGTGGISCGASAVLEGNRILGNGTGDYVAGVNCSGPTTIRGNLISGNGGSHEALVGGIASTGPGVLIEGNRVVENRLGGIYCFSGSATIQNNVISDNDGPGIQVAYDFVATIANSTIVANAPFSWTPLILEARSSVTVVNTILWNAGATEIRVRPTCALAIAFSDLDGGRSAIELASGATLVWGPGMMDEEPGLGGAIETRSVTRMHELSSGTEFHLSRHSPCINRGTSALAPAVDIDGDPRPAMGTVDIGADEYVARHSLAADRFALSATTGGEVAFLLDASAHHRGEPYVLLACFSGTNPGTRLPGGEQVLPLNWDSFTSWMIRLLDQAPFQGFAGTLDGVGRRTARFDTLGPLPPESVGLTISFAFGVTDSWALASNPINVEIGP